MALSKKNAIEAAQNIMYGPRATEMERLRRISRALRPGPLDPLTVELPKDAPQVMKNLAAKSRTNFLPLVVDTFAQIMKVDGYSPAKSPDNGAAWTYWQQNAMDARQAGVHYSALGYGASYLTVLPGDRGPAMRGVSALQMTAVYQDPVEDEWPMLALRVDGDLLRLYDEEQVYFIGRRNAARSGLGGASVHDLSAGFGGMDYIEARPHGLGVCPVVRFRDRMMLEGEEQFGIVEPIISIQERIDETTFGLLVAQYYAAFKQRYVVGWIPKSEEEDLRASAAEFWSFEDPDVKVGEFTETDLTRYLKSKDSAALDMAAISQVPAQTLSQGGISNISAETLAALEAGKDRRADQITTSFGESWEQALRACSQLAGDTEAAQDFSAEVHWKDATARSLAQTVDALGKMVTMLNVPPQAVWPDIPGWTDQKQQRATQALKDGDSLALLTETLNRQAGDAGVA